MSPRDPIEDDAPEAPVTGALTATEILGMLRVQWRVIATALVVVLVVTLVGSLLARKKYRANAVIQISSGAGQEVQVDGVVDFDRLSQERTYAKTQLDLLRSRELREEVLRRYEALGLGDLAELTVADGGLDRLDERLSIVQRKDSELVDISITDTDPERAARLANLVSEVYRQQNLDGRRDSAREAKVWLQQQLTDYKQRILDESAALITYQNKYDLADAEEEITRLSASMGALNLAYGEVNTQRVLLETTVASHQRLLANDAYEAVAKDMNTALVVALTGEYSTAAAENAEMAARYLEQMPERIYSEAKLRGIDQELRKEVDRTLTTEKAQLDMLRAKESSLVTAIDAAKAQLLDRQALRGEYERLKLRLGRSKEFYSTISQRDGELDLVSRTHLSNVRVIDAARPEPKPVSPNVPKNLALALVLGGVLGVVIGFLVEYLNDTISTPFDVATYLRVPFLGMLPRLADAADDRARALYIQEHRNSTAAEAVRAIRTLLELSPNAKSLRRVLVTSSHASEGKTNTIVSLAVSFASLGRRVLLVDADMRRPRVHDIFGIEKTHGLASLLQGAPLESGLMASGIKNLDLLPAGPMPEGPNELLASVAMADLLDQLDQRYDMVFIDTPPTGILSDAAILSKLVDGVVFVVREKTVSRWVAREAIFRLQQVGANVLGAIINDVDLSKRRSKYKYHHYEYRYKYEENDKPSVAAK